MEQAITETSRKDCISLNKATLKLLEISLKKPTLNHDFDEFFGAWTAAEAQEFDTILNEQRRIDRADWETPGE